MYRVLISGIIISMHLLSGATAVFSQDYNIRYNIIDSLITVREYRQSFTSCTLAINSLPVEEQVPFLLKAAQSLCYLGESDLAKTYLDKTQEAPTEFFNEYDKALQWHVQALYLMKTNQDSLAEVNFTRAEAVLHTCCGERVDFLGDLYLDWARLLQQKGDFDAAFNTAETSFEFLRKGKNRLKIVRSLLRIGDILRWDIGDIELAFDYITRAEEMWHQDEEFPLSLWLEGQLLMAATQNARDQWDKSIESYKASLNRLDDDDGSYQRYIPYILLNIGTNYIESSDPRAYQYLWSAIQHQLRLIESERDYLYHAYEKLGVHYRKQGHLDSSVFYLNQCIEYYLSDSNVRIENAYLELAETHLLAGELQKALQAVDHSMMVIGYPQVLNLDPSNLTENIDQIFNPLELKGRIFLAYYQLHGDTSSLYYALEIYELLETLSEESRSGTYSDNTQLLVSEHFYRAAAAALQAIQQLYSITGDTKYLAKAFAFMEHNRYASLFINLSHVKAIPKHQIPDSIRQKERNFDARLEAIRSKIALDTASTLPLRDSLLQVANAKRDFKEKISREFPLYYEVEYDRLFNLDQIRKKLPITTQLIEYFWSDSFIHIISISRDTVILSSRPTKIVSLPLEKILSWLADPYSDQNSFNFHQFRNLSFLLYQELLEPYLEIDKQKIIISPDGPLVYLPFDILLSDTSQLNFRDAAYLLKSHTLQYTFSSNLLFSTSSPLVGQEPQLLAMAFSDHIQTKNVSDAASNIIAYSSREVDGIRRQFRRGKVEVLKGLAASKRNFKRLVPTFNMLHLAIHGLADRETTRGSYLLFNDEQDTLDGRLYAYELYNLQLDRLRLVVLSACESGAGKSLPGEGTFSIARGFSRQNTGSIVMSLWKADDQVTAEIMQHFYRNLSRGQPTSEAIRHAKIRYLKNSPDHFAIPPYWAAFIPLGPDMAMANVGRWQEGMAIAIILGSIIFLAFFYLRKKRIDHIDKS